MVTQIRVFNDSTFSHEEQINAWMKENPDIEVISILSQMFQDHYTGSQANQICNEWFQTTVLYKTNI